MELPISKIIVADYGTAGWNAIYANAFQIIDARLGYAMQEDRPENVDFFINTTTKDGSTSITIRNTEDIDVFEIKSNGILTISNSLYLQDSIYINNIQIISEQQEAIANTIIISDINNIPTSYTTNTIKDLITDITALQTTINSILTAMRNHGLIATT